MERGDQRCDIEDGRGRWNGLIVDIQIEMKNCAEWPDECDGLDEFAVGWKFMSKYKMVSLSAEHVCLSNPNERISAKHIQALPQLAGRPLAQQEGGRFVQE